jgi:hypothetical protein
MEPPCSTAFCIFHELRARVLMAPTVYTAHLSDQTLYTCDDTDALFLRCN